MSNLQIPIVKANAYLTLHYCVATKEGVEIVSTYQGNPATLQLGQGQLAAPLEHCLLGMKEGEQKVFELPSEAAFGPRNPELIQLVSKATLEQNSEPGHQYAVGDLVEFAAPAGGEFAGVLREFSEEGAWFDFNHPLAGREITFTARIIGVL